MKSLIVWGAGELGTRVARRWVELGGAVVGVTATRGRHASLQDDGVVPQLATEATVPPEALLVLSVPGSAQQLRVIEALRGTPRRARTVLVSSTAALKPGARGDAAREAEAAFRAWAGPQGVVLRFGGLYRLGRGPGAYLLRSGTAPVGPADAILGLIHYDDAATACLSALVVADPEPVYVCVTDPSPTRRAFYEAACAQHGLPAPVFAGPGALVDYDTTAHVRDLVPVPTWPDWRAAID